MADTPVAAPLSSSARELMATLKKALQEAIDWLGEKIDTNRSDTNELVKLLEMQQAFVGTLVSSFTESRIGASPSDEVQRLRRELLPVLRNSFDLVIKLAKQSLEDTKRAQSEIERLENEKRRYSNASEPSVPEGDTMESLEDLSASGDEERMHITEQIANMYDVQPEIKVEKRVDSTNQLRREGGTLYDQERRLLQYRDAHQTIIGDFANTNASPSDVPTSKLGEKVAAHLSLLFNRAKDAQDVLKHFKGRMNLEMKEKVHKLEMAIEWMRDDEHMDVDEAERIAKYYYMEETERMDD